jgi:uncharacterized membrane protein YraQ (UPF0718 family)
MPELFTAFTLALYDLSNDMAVYILAGLFFAGVLHELVPTAFVEKHLGRDNVASVIKATLFGVPLPVCSCGVIPLATAIKKSGASNGATLSFLISTPITGVDSILATFGMFGWAFTLYRVLTSMVIATVAGILNNYLITEAPKPAFSATTSPSAQPAAFGLQPRRPAETGNGESCCGSSCGCPEPKPGFSFGAAMRYGFVTLLGDIAKPLFWGLLIGAAIAAAVPEDLSAFLGGYPWLGYLIVVAIAVPMYVCATASLPIAASLILAGVAPGAAFVFLSAGPATNTVTIGVVKKMLGMRSLAIYLGTIVGGSIVFGIGMDLLFSAADIDIRGLLDTREEAGMIAVGSSVAMWLLLLYFMARSFLPKEEASCCENR